MAKFKVGDKVNYTGKTFKNDVVNPCVISAVEKTAADEVQYYCVLDMEDQEKAEKHGKDAVWPWHFTEDKLERVDEQNR